MPNKLRQIGKTGVMIKEGYTRGDKAFDEALKNILGNLKAQAEEKKNKKDKKKKTKLKKIKDVETT
tara:strand:+ start:583 stop:780 length:198 start_codon:yes stop_codon:yes gene_type:complete